MQAPVENQRDPNTLKSVTLSVSPEEAAKLSLAQTRGTLELALRSDSDHAAAATMPVTVKDLRFLQEPPRPNRLAECVSGVLARGMEASREAPEPPAAAPVPPEAPPQPIMVRTLRGNKWGASYLQPYGPYEARPTTPIEPRDTRLTDH